MGRELDILKAATKLFYERGFHAVGVDDVGAQAGISGPAIYRHFSGKHEILATLFDRALDRFFLKVGPALEDPHEELAHLVRTHAAVLLDDRKLASIYVREEHALTEASRRRVHRRQLEYVDRWLDTLRRCYPDRPEGELRAAAYGSIGLLNSVSQWPRQALRVDDLDDLLSELVLRGLATFSEAAQPELS